MIRHLRTVGLAVMIGAIAACGFHLRGSYDLPEHLSPVFLDKDSMSLLLHKELRTALGASGAELAEDAATAASVIEISREQRTRDVLAVDASGRAREYRLIYRLTFSLQVSGEAVIKNSNIQRTRNMLFDPDAILSIEQEINNVYKDMIRDSAGQILLRLQALK